MCPMSMLPWMNNFYPSKHLKMMHSLYSAMTSLDVSDQEYEKGVNSRHTFDVSCNLSRASTIAGTLKFDSGCDSCAQNE